MQKQATLRIEFRRRPGNGEVAIFLNLITLLFGDPEKELAWEDRGLTWFFEDSLENVELLSEVIRNHSWDDKRFDENRKNPYVQMEMSVFNNEAHWSQFLSQTLDNLLMFTSIIPT